MVVCGGNLASRATCLTDDEKLALVCCADVVKIHNTKAGGVVGILKGHDRSVTGVCTVAGDRNQVLTSSLDGTLKLWDLEAQKCLSTIDIGLPVTQTTMSSSGSNTVYCAVVSKHADAYWFGDESVANTIEGRIQMRTGIAAPDQLSSAAGSEAATPVMKLIEVSLTDGLVVRTFAKRKGYCVGLTSRPTRPSASRAVAPSDAATTASGEYVVGAIDKSVFIYNTLTKAVAKYDHAKPVTTVALHPKEGYMAVGDVLGMITLVHCLNDQTDNKIVKKFAARSQQEDFEETASDPFTAFMRPVNLRKLATNVHHWHAHAVQTVVFTGDGLYMLSGGEEAVLVIWQLETGKKNFLPRLGATIKRLAVHPMSTYYCLSLADSSLLYISASSLRSSWRVKGLAVAGNPFSVACVLGKGLVVDPRTHAAVVNGTPGRGTLQFYDTASDSHVLELDVEPRNVVSRVDTLPAPGLDVSHAAFSPDGLLLVTVERREVLPVDLVVSSSGRENKRRAFRQLEAMLRAKTQGQPGVDDEMLPAEDAEVGSVQDEDGLDGDEEGGDNAVGHSAEGGRQPATAASRKSDSHIEGIQTLKFWTWSPAMGKYVLNTRVDSPHKAPITGLEFRPTTGQPLVVTSSADRTFKLWECKRPKIDPSIAAEQQRAQQSHSGNTKHQQVQDGLVVNQLMWMCRSVGFYRDMPATCTAFSGDGSLLAVAYSHILTLWSPTTNELKMTLTQPKPSMPIQQVAFIGASQYLVASTASQLFVWDLLTCSVAWSYKASVTSIATPHMDIRALRAPSSVRPLLAVAVNFATSADHKTSKRSTRSSPEAASGTSDGSATHVVLFDAASPVPVHVWEMPRGMHVSAITVPAVKVDSTAVAAGGSSSDNIPDIVALSSRSELIVLSPSDAHSTEVGGSAADAAGAQVVGRTALAALTPVEAAVSAFEKRFGALVQPAGSSAEVAGAAFDAGSAGDMANRLASLVGTPTQAMPPMAAMFDAVMDVLATKPGLAPSQAEEEGAGSYVAHALRGGTSVRLAYNRDRAGSDDSTHDPAVDSARLAAPMWGLSASTAKPGSTGGMVPPALTAAVRAHLASKLFGISIPITGPNTTATAESGGSSKRKRSRSRNPTVVAHGAAVSAEGAAAAAAAAAVPVTAAPTTPAKPTTNGSSVSQRKSTKGKGKGQSQQNGGPSTPAPAMNHVTPKKSAKKSAKKAKTPATAAKSPAEPTPKKQRTPRPKRRSTRVAQQA